MSLQRHISYLRRPRVSRSLGFVAQLEEIEDVQHRLSDVGAKAVGVLQCERKKKKARIKDGRLLK